MYQPAFTETFVALLAVILWSRWLDDPEQPGPTWARWLPWVAGIAVGLGQMVGGFVVLTATEPPGTRLMVGRWLGMGACLVVLLIQGGLTARRIAARRSA